MNQEPSVIKMDELALASARAVVDIRNRFKSLSDLRQLGPVSYATDLDDVLVEMTHVR